MYKEANRLSCEKTTVKEEKCLYKRNPIIVILELLFSYNFRIPNMNANQCLPLQGRYPSNI